MSEAKISDFDRKSGNSGTILISERFKPSHVVRKFYKESYEKVSFLIKVQNDAQNGVKWDGGFSMISVCAEKLS